MDGTLLPSEVDDVGFILWNAHLSWLEGDLLNFSFLISRDLSPKINSLGRIIELRSGPLANLTIS
jgi:hypothetical protein